jgi:hypothetical protein
MSIFKIKEGGTFSRCISLYVGFLDQGKRKLNVPPVKIKTQISKLVP